MKKIVGFLLFVSLLMLLSACQSKPKVFSQHQVQVLQQQGFEPIGDDEWMLSLSGLILFGFNDHQLTDESREQVQQLGKSLLEASIIRLRIEGHADNQGNEDYNLMLSKQRADVVADELSTMGLSRDFIQVQGIGSMYPVVSNDTREGRAQNRRVTIIVSP